MDNIARITDPEDEEFLPTRVAIERCRTGDRQAYRVIVETYKERAYFTAVGLVGDHDDALDLSQEAFVRAFGALKSFDVERSFYTWFYAILRNLCLNHIRDKKKFSRLASEHSTIPDLDGDHHFNELRDTDSDPSVLAEQNDLSEKVWIGIRSLKPEEREVIVLKDIEGCSYKEIAERVAIPIGTVMSRLYTARKNLKSELEEML